MKKAIAILFFSALLFVIAIIWGNSSTQVAQGNGPSVNPSHVSNVVLPPEQLPQFKNISVYTPQKVSSNVYIDPPNDLEQNSEEYQKIQSGVM